MVDLHYHFVKEDDVNEECVIEREGHKARHDGPNFKKMRKMLIQTNMQQNTSLSRDERLHMLDLAIQYHEVETVREAAAFLNVARSTVKLYLKDLHKTLPER